MEVPSWIILMVHLTQGVCGILFNAIVIFLVLKKTPKQLASYSILIFNFAICDLVACASALFVQHRMICDGLAIYLLSQGPCSYFGPPACIIGHSIMIHCFTHGLWSLAFSFLYRYYILGHEQPRNSTIISIIALIYTPSFLQLVLMSTVSDDEAVLKAELERKFGYTASLETTAILPITGRSFFSLSAPVGISGFGTTVLYHTCTFKAYRSTALTVQAVLPTLYLASSSIYFAEQLYSYRNQLFEYLVFILLNFTPMLTPLTSLYFIGPYRVWMQNTFLFRAKVAQPLSKARVQVVSVDITRNTL
ncbi:hypothetical protein GCK32_016116 [Trichostrongylus colubriformis]|uniref:G protein-coupled receptor n=1 Tax=Trichostrongylus colubriformis TaxID=6319 RepID=A0AAN8F772_TRICO